MLALSEMDEFVDILSSGSKTPQEIADAIEQALGHLLHPGSRVYPADTNRSIFWSLVISRLTE